MEISAAGRLEVRITTADVGKRVSVRSLTEHGPPGERFTDTVGVLTSWDDGVLRITRKGGESVLVRESALVAGKVVPSAPARRRGPAASYEELARVAARAWRPVESERLGDWELRAAAGFTRRANSVLPLGDPGMPLDEALAAVCRWYADRGLPAYVQTATGAEGTQEALGAELERRGWVREVTAQLWVGALAPVADAGPEPSGGGPGGVDVLLSREADEAWLARYRRRGVSEVALKVLGGGSPVGRGGPSVWFATVPAGGDGPGSSGSGGDGPGDGAEGGAAPAAIGRCVVDGRWAGFAAVEVDPALRRRGLASAVMAALARRALDEGASAAWLQVEADNAAAHALYGRMGFAAHHAYHHYRAPRSSAPAGDGSP
ncbi:GNAT family N-acetyltransferase [Streptomyces prasinus]|uniref:GNAT family N-acetyltransferase n=2 Tax=Streptomyces prasinus TaxID=67345 RepID=A0ABX6B090_9ACTN|nr:GNAT family N-acetyltransferase [Streptomyces prasinus]QEV08183.1 GNAT family N-acetyltransferase [Streptomyces prasinus]